MIIIITTTFRLNLNKQITCQTDSGGTKDVEIMVPLKYLSNFWRTLKIQLINCDSNLILTWSANCVYYCCKSSNNICSNWYKVYVSVATLSTQNNARPLQQLKWVFKRTIIWNKKNQK